MTPKHQTVMIPANAFFKLLADLAFDRPSAFRLFARYAGIRRPRTLAMRRDEITKEEKQYLNEIFGGRIPSTLMKTDWDT